MTGDPVQVFISHALEDKTYSEALKRHLTPLERRGQLAVWKEGAGNRNEQRDAALADADIVVVLLSIHLISSKELYEHELTAAVKAQQVGRCYLLPVTVRHFDWSHVDHLGLRPRPGTPELPPEPPISDLPEHAEQKAWKGIAQEIRVLASKVHDYWPSRLSDDAKAFVRALEEQRSVAPPYVASSLLTCVRRCERVGRDEVSALADASRVILGQVAALLASAMREDERPSPPERQGFETWVVDHPLEFLNRCDGTSAADLFFSGEGLTRLLEAYRAVQDGVATTAPNLPDLRNRLRHVLLLARRPLSLPISVVSTSFAQDDDAREVTCEEYRHDGDSQLKTRHLEARQPEPRSGCCIVAVNDPRREGTGLLLHLFPWVARLHLDNPDNPQPAIGLLAPGNTNGHSGPHRYYLQSGIREVKRRDGKRFIAPAKIGDGWFAKSAPIDPDLLDYVKNKGIDIKERIGEGSFGTVYRVSHPDLDRQKLALKVFHPGVGISRSEIQRVRREITRMANASDDHVVRYVSPEEPGCEWAVSLEGRYRWVTMEYVDGEPLSRWHSNPEARRVEVRERLARDLIQGVACLHRRGIVHRDLRPENIIVERRGSEWCAVIVDLGLAWIPPASDATRRSSTIADMGFGVLPYAPPEQKRLGAGVSARDPWVDVHAVAWTIAFLLTGGVLPQRIEDVNHAWAPLLARWADEHAERRPRDGLALARELDGFCASSETFAVGRTLADGSFAIGGSPMPDRDAILQVVPPAPFADLRAWTVRVHGEQEEVGRLVGAWRELERWGAPMAPLLTWASERQAVILTVGAPARAEGGASLLSWSPPDRSIGAFARLLTNLFDLAQALHDAGGGVAVSPRDIFVEPSGKVRVIGLRPPSADRTEGSVIAAHLQALLKDLLGSTETLDAIDVLVGKRNQTRGLGWQETRYVGPLLLAAVEGIGGLAGVFDGDLVALVRDDRVVFSALTRAVTPVLDDGVEAVDLFEQQTRSVENKVEQRRHEHGEAQERDRKKHDAEQERQRVIHEAEQERERATHEADQELKRASHEADQKHRPRDDWSDWTPRPFEPKLFPWKPFRPAEFDAQGVKAAFGVPISRSEAQPSRIELRVAVEDDDMPNAMPRARAARPFEQPTTRLERALRSATTLDVFERRAQVVLADSAAWLIALLTIPETRLDLEEALRHAALEAPWWRSRDQVRVMLREHVSIARTDAFVSPEQRQRLLGCVERATARLDANGVSLVAGDHEAGQVRAEYLRAAHDALADLQFEPDKARVMRSDRARSLCAPFFQFSGRAGSMAWVQGARLDEDSLRFWIGAPPEVPVRLVASPAHVVRAAPPVASEALAIDEFERLHIWIEALALIDPTGPSRDGTIKRMHVADAGVVIVLHPAAGQEAPIQCLQFDRQSPGDDAWSLAGLAAKGMPLKRLFDARKRLPAEADVECVLVADRSAASDLEEYLSRQDGALLDTFFEEARAHESIAARAREIWKRALDVRDDELGELCRSLRLRLGVGLDELRANVDNRMRTLDLGAGPGVRARALEIVGRWLAADAPVSATAVHTAIDGAALRVAGRAAPTVSLWVHGWAEARFDGQPTEVLDWTRHFRFTSRTIASARVWETELFPQLDHFKQKHVPQGGAIDLRGKLPLTAMLAIGATFPRTEGFRFRVEQPVAKESFLWWSDAEEVGPAAASFTIVHEQMSERGEDLLVVFSITGDAMPEVGRMIEALEGGFRAVVHLQPASGAGPKAIGSDGEAVSLAKHAAALLRDLRAKHRARRTHVVLYAPAGFCLFLGQRLAGAGEVVTYERTETRGYRASVVLRTGEA